MNHYPMRRVSWVTSEDGVEFVTRAALDEGDQVYNNYGPKSNEELMMGYGFCIKNNPFSYFHIKLNYSQDPLAGQKQQILGRAGLSESSQYIRLGELPRDLLPMLRVMAMSDVDVYFACSLDATVARESLAYVSLRNEIRARNLLIFLLEKKLANFQSAEADIPSISSDNASVAREYRKEIHDILCSTLADLKSAMQQLLGFGCSLFKLGKHSLPSYACSEGFVPFDKTSHSPDDSNANGGSSPKASHVKKARVSNSEERFAKEVLVTAAAFERDLEFYEAIQQIDVEEDTLYVLFLIRALFSNTLPWSAAVKRLEEFKHPMQLYEQDSAVVESYGEMMLEMGEIYESLFPLLTEHFPQVFPAAQYTQERFLWAAGIVESFRVVVPVWQGGNGDEIEGLCLI
ncbi:hypothetical protein GGI12_001813 [Dipsacomyces acuminosporus]|nr:hypothetical protein GGI12_001813 [Dipsacomyces acuminosporus]